MVFLVVDLAHAHLIAALVVDQNKALLTFSTDVSEYVALTAQNVNVALSFIEVVKISALKAKRAILGRTAAGRRTHFSPHLSPHS